MAETAAPEVLWRDGRRYLPALAPLPRTAAIAPFQPGKSYLLAGGLGEVGRALATHALGSGAHVAILGRRGAAAADPALAALRAAAAGGARIAYAGCDLTDATGVRGAIASLRATLCGGAFHGVLHLARAVEDGPVATKSDAALRRVLAPKLAGTLALDAALAEEPLEWFALCSSLAAWFGLAGGADYAAACAWQGGFAEMRQAQVLRGERQGRTVAIAWPQWAYDRYATPAKLAALAHRGVAPLTAEDGVALLGSALSLAAEPPASLAAVKGDRTGFAALRDALGHAAEETALPPGGSIEAELAGLSDAKLAEYLGHLREAAPSASPQAPTMPRPSRAAPPLDFPERAAAPEAAPPAPARDTESELRAVLSAHLKLPPERLAPEAEFASIGLDSIRALQAAERLGRRFGLPIDATAFFEHPTMAALAAAIDAQRGAAPLFAPMEAGE
jgi:NAD(P)-dependent dehydrogenase (short-subunit alcohol dehydrogenase family)/aryl carrier-like protein